MLTVTGGRSYQPSQAGSVFQVVPGSITQSFVRGRPLVMPPGIGPATASLAPSSASRAVDPRSRSAGRPKYGDLRVDTGSGLQSPPHHYEAPQSRRSPSGRQLSARVVHVSRSPRQGAEVPVGQAQGSKATRRSLRGSSVLDRVTEAPRSVRPPDDAGYRTHASPAARPRVYK